MEASSPQVPPITSHLVLECPPSPLPQASQVSTCQGVTGQSPVSHGLKAANHREEGRRSANPSRGEVCGPLSV